MADIDTASSREVERVRPPGRHHAVWCMTLNMGSCNGCDQQIISLLAPRYALQRRGISFAMSPRHADIILLTGALTRQGADVVRRVLAQVPDPHALIAVGDCAINGGVFARSDLIIPNAAEVLGVNIEIAGNPPSPAQILLAIEEAAQLLDGAESGEDDEEEKQAEAGEEDDEEVTESDDEDEEDEDSATEDEEAKKDS